MTWNIPTQPSMPADALADFKQQVRELSNTFDAELTRKLASAVDYVQNVTNRQVLRATAVYTADCFPTFEDDSQLRFFLPPSPLVSVTTVEYYPADDPPTGSNPPTVLPATEYAVFPEEEPGYIRPAFGKTWPAVSDGVRVTYECGYADWASAAPHVKEPILMYGEEIYRGSDWGDKLQAALNNALVGDEFVTYP